VLLALTHGVPLLTAGIREGKNDINAHVDYFKVGSDLRTEAPRPADIARNVERLLTEPHWKQNVARLREEFSRYYPFELIDAYLANIKASGATAAAQKVAADPKVIQAA
jgi:UDP:flavonoid glycosyltransferase YjiC (YdhE family)